MHLGNWIQKLEETGPDRIAVCLVGNKIDLEELRVVKTEEIAQLADELDATYQETSALDDSGISVK